MKKTLRIGSGAGYGGDRLEPALELLENAQLDYLAFECLAERTIALAQKERRLDSSKGYNSLLSYRMEKSLPLAYKNRVKLITNMGAANPLGALEVVGEIADKLTLKGLKIAAITGDDVLELVLKNNHLKLIESGKTVASLGNSILSANAYLGTQSLVEALENDADVILCGRVADPSLFLAPLIHEFKWNSDDYLLLGKGTLVGHLLECAGQICGGYYSNGDQKQIPDLWNLGFPYAEINSEGMGFISKLDQSGGQVSVATCTEQMIYEIHDPSRYITPDCVADFSKVQFREIAKDRIAFSEAHGTKPTDTYKVSIGYLNGFLGEGQISYAGKGCLERAQQAADIVRKRIEITKIDLEELQIDFIGWDSTQMLPSNLSQEPREVRLRVVGKSKTKQEAQRLANEVETLYTNGPYGGGGASKHLEEVISVQSVLIPKEWVKTQITYKTIS